MVAPELIRRSTVPQLLVAGACATCAIVFAGLAAYGKPGLGIGQGFYLAIALIALAAGPLTGAAAGLAATFLYATALAVGGHGDVGGPTALQLTIRLAYYVAVGVTIGYVARSGRRMLAKSLHVLDELLILAGREVEGGALSPSGFEAAVIRHVADGEPFAILIGEVRRSVSSPGGSGSASTGDRLQEAIRDARSCVPPGYPLARAGRSRLAVILPGGTESASLEACAQLSSELQKMGWQAAFAHAAFPDDGGEMMPLLQTAIERLHRNQVVAAEAV